VARDNRNKKKKNPVVRLSVTFFLIVIIGFIIFYAIDNPEFLGSIFNRGESGENINSNNTEETVDTTEEVPLVSGSPSLWQQIVSFFREKFNPSEETENYPSRIAINVYFAGMGEEKILVAEERTIIAGNPGNALKSAIGELLKGPLKDYNFPVIPAGTKLLESKFIDGVAEIDFSREFLDNALDNRILDEYIIYSIVNTVTGIPDVSGVIFLIEGKRIKAYGNIDLSIPLIRNTDLLIEQD
jgi:spore germination protein GerM